MSPEAQREAIAQFTGARAHQFDETRQCNLCCQFEREDPYNYCVLADVPDYLHDLNAMHEAEARGGQAVIKAMRFHLWRICDQMTSHHATAAQRAEAFLRSVGKWDDSK
jgi:hypothetical protein